MITHQFGNDKSEAYPKSDQQRIPSAIVPKMSGEANCAPLAILMSPLAIRKMQTPGIIDTTAANPIAANGIWARRVKGVRTSPTTQPAKAATAGLCQTLSAMPTGPRAPAFQCDWLRQHLERVHLRVRAGQTHVALRLEESSRTSGPGSGPCSRPQAHVRPTRIVRICWGIGRVASPRIIRRPNCPG
jgi:hypothetical protein